MKRQNLIFSIMFIMFTSIVLLAGCGGQKNAEVEEADQQSTEQSGVNIEEQEKTDSDEPLFGYIGAGLKEPFEELMEMYEVETGKKIEANYNNSGSLITQLETAETGDIFMPGGMPFVKKVEEKDHIELVEGPIAYHTPVIVTPKENPANIQSFDDLTNEAAEIIVPELEATALGKTLAKIMKNAELYDDIEENIIVQVETAPKITSTLLLGEGNAAITEHAAWAKQKEKLELIEIDPAINEVDEIPIAVLTFSKQKEEATKFAKFVAQEGPAIFEKHGFKTEPPVKN